MRKIYACILICVLAVSVTVLDGCGPGNGLNLARVSGRVTYKGEPVKHGTVFFMPDESKGTVGQPAVGGITQEGNYALSSESAGDGVIVGQHMVGITGLEPVGDTQAAEIDPMKDPAGFMKAKGKAAVQATRSRPKNEEDLYIDKGGKKYRYVVTKKLSNPTESGIRVQVDGGRTVNFDIDESGNVKIGP